MKWNFTVSGFVDRSIWEVHPTFGITSAPEEDATGNIEGQGKNPVPIPGPQSVSGASVKPEVNFMPSGRVPGVGSTFEQFRVSSWDMDISFIGSMLYVDVFWYSMREIAG
ncbi:hypothetical protein [Streptomyces sp. NPDC058664]|uniref:hypothetical protein n=1 Tax=unclassified Streptomyces TaxID=2593676 RepID=UPI00365287E1